MTILTGVLSALSLGKKPNQPIQPDDIAEYIADLKRANEARDNWRDSSKEWEAKFKVAATDLAKQAEEIADLKDDLRFADAVLAAQKRDVDAFKADAQKWRNSLKRSRDRKAGKKGVAL